VPQTLRDTDATVRRTALAAVARHRIDSAGAVVTELLGSDDDWPTRVRAAETLGALGAAGGAGAISALGRAASADREDLVREAAVRALFTLDRTGSRAVLEAVAAKAEEPRVREAAAKLLGGK
jgi:HEAT repeat protein